MTGPACIFISYSRKDGAGPAATLCNDLEAEHLSVWQDIHALEGNRDWWSQIEEALRSKALQHFVLVVTPGALQSQVVRREIRLARQEGKTVSPVKGPSLGDLNKLPRWLGNVCDLDIPERRAALMRVLAGPSKQNRVPMMAPEPPADFVQRPHEFGALKAKLLDATGDAVAITAALRGAGGYGKTTLAKSLAHDPDIADAFFDGILWVELGEKPVNLLSVVSDLTETLTGERPGLENLSAAAAKLGEALGNRRILLIIDDAWRELDLRPFLQGGRNTTRLVTTRRDDILPLNAQRQPVDAMQGGEALALLAWGLPEDQAAAQKRALEALAARLGEWAQLLKLVNGFLRDRVLKSRQLLDQAIQGVNKRLDEKGLDAFSARDEADRRKAIAKTIGVSLDLLSESERGHFAELAVFPEDVDVPIGIAARLWARTGGLDEVDTEDLLVRLETLSLLLSLDLERRSFRFHDTVRKFLQNQGGKEMLAALHKTLLEAMEGIETADEPSRRYYYLHRPAHLADAHERAALNIILEDPAWLQAKLNALDSPQALIEDYEQFGQGHVQELIRRTLRLTFQILTRDTRQLLPQLQSRLMSNFSALPFCTEAIQVLAKPAIVTRSASLTGPGAELTRIEVGRNVEALCVLPNGRLASGSSDGLIRVWEVSAGIQTAVLSGHAHRISSLTALADNRLASGSWDETIRIWDLNTCSQIACLEGHRGTINALCTLPNDMLVSGANDIRLWGPNSYEEKLRLRNEGKSVESLCVLRDMSLVSASDDGVRIWDIKLGVETDHFYRDTHVSLICLLSDGRLAIADLHDHIRIWDLATRTEARCLKGHTDVIGALCTIGNGLLASASWDHTIKLWNLNDGTEVKTLEGHSDWVNALQMMPDRHLASASHDGTIKFWDITSNHSEVGIESHGASVNALITLPDNQIASASGDVAFFPRSASIRIWNVRSCRQITKFDFGPGKTVFAVCALPDGRLASASRDKSIQLWDLTAGAVSGELVGHTSWIHGLCLLRDGRLASASHDGTIRLWDVAKGIETLRVDAPTSKSALLGLSDGSLVYGSDKIIQIETASGTMVASFGEGANAIALLPNGSLVSGKGSLIKLWDLKSKSEVAQLESEAKDIKALAVLPDWRLVSGSSDGIIRLWNLISGNVICKLQVDAAVTSLLVLPNGNLVAGDRLGRLHWLEILD